VKRLLPLLAVAALIVAPAAWSAHRSAPTMHPGKLVVGLNPPAVGFQVGTLRGNSVIHPSGLEVSLATDIAKQLGIKPSHITWINVPWTTLFRPGNKPFDLAFEEATITTARARVVDFSSSYMTANQGVLLAKGATAPKNLAQLKNMSLCAQADTTGLAYLQSQMHIPLSKIHVYNATAAAFSALAVGRCQAFVMDVPIVLAQKKSKPSAYGALAGQIVTNEHYGAVLPKGSKLTKDVSKAINTLNKNGTIGKLEAKWFNYDFSKIKVLK